MNKIFFCFGIADRKGLIQQFVINYDIGTHNSLQLYISYTFHTHYTHFIHIVKWALNLLFRARVASPVYPSSCGGIPLGAAMNTKKFKVLFLDVGLMSTATGLNLLDFEKAEDVMRVNAGAICEEFIGQHLLFSQQPYCEPEVYYWLREKKNSSAEVDYVISEGAHIVPIEVKAGKSGTLKSLHLFLHEKHGSFGVRFNSDMPSVLEPQTALPGRPNISYRLLSLPLYMVGQLRRLIRQEAITHRVFDAF